MVDLRVSSGHLLRYAGGGGGSGEPKKIMGLAIAGLRIALAGGVDERGACQWWYAGMSLRYVGRSAVVEGKSRGSKGRMWRVEEARTQRLSSRVGAVICIVRGTLEHASAALSIRGVRRERHYRGARVAREIGLPASLL
jgi:hypothetical protein